MIGKMDILNIFKKSAKLPDAIVSFGGSEDGLSVLGASHLKSGKPCQDSGGHHRCDEFAVAVVCDGHGGDPYFRSDRGSKFAVETCIDSVREFMQGKTDFLKKMSAAENDIIKGKLSSQAIEQLIKSIIFRWSERVGNDIAEHPFTEEDYASLEEKYRERYQKDDDSKFPAYGTTLIAVVRAPEFWFGMRIGDGRCVSVGADGTIEDPIPWNEKMLFERYRVALRRKSIREFQVLFPHREFSCCNLRWNRRY
jgi:hypothetical protein